MKPDPDEVIRDYAKYRRIVLDYRAQQQRAGKSRRRVAARILTRHSRRAANPVLRFVHWLRSIIGSR